MHKLSTSDQVGHLLSARRKELGFTQAAVAALLGISQNRLRLAIAVKGKNMHYRLKDHTA